MPTPAQAGAAVATAGVLSAGSYGIYHYSTSSQEDNEIPKEPRDVVTFALTQPNQTLDTPYQTGVLGVLKKSNLGKIVKGTVETNEGWWKWALTKFNKSNLAKKSPFSGITEGYSKDDKAGALNQACEKAYKTPKAKLNEQDNLLLESIGAFCTTGSTTDVSEPEPTVYATGDDVTAYPNGVLTIPANKSKLVKTTATAQDNNELWWKWAFSKRVTEESKKTFTSFFKQVEEGYSTSNANALNKKCDEAYKKNKVELQTADNNSTIIKDIEKLCSIDPSFTLTLPGDAVVAKPSTTAEVLTATDVGNSGSYHEKLVSYMKPANLAHLLKNSANNKKWWEWRHQEKYAKHTTKTDLDDTFKFVTQPYGANPTPAKTGTTTVEEIYLNQACDAAYKKSKEDYKFKDSHLLANIAEFCLKENTQVDVTEPKHTAFASSFEHSTSYPGGVLSVQANKEQLVTKDAVNKEWWNWALAKRMTKEAKTGLSAAFSSVTTEGYGESAVAGTGPQTALNHACDAAYKKPRTDLVGTGNNNQLFNEIKKFCSVNPTTNTIALPEAAPASTTPTLIDSSKATTTYKDKDLFKNSANLNKLVDPDEGNNKTWWDNTYNEKYKKLYDSKKDKLPAPFKSVGSGHETGDNPTALNQACKKAYSESTANLKTETEIETNNKKTLLALIKEFCSISSEDLAKPS